MDNADLQFAEGLLMSLAGRPSPDRGCGGGRRGYTTLSKPVFRGGGRGCRDWRRARREIPNAYYGFRLVAGPPAGKGSLFAIVTEDPVSLEDFIGPSRDLRPVPNGRDWLLALAERLRKPWLGEAGSREARWSMDRGQYEIVP